MVRVPRPYVGRGKGPQANGSGCGYAKCSVAKVPRSDDGLEALVFTAEGDMRQVGLGTGLPVPYFHLPGYL